MPDAEHLIQQLFAEDTRQEAEHCLVARGSAAVLIIAELFTSQALDTQVRLAIVLGKIGDARAIPVLAEALQEAAPTSARVRMAAIRALGRIGRIECLDIVEEYQNCAKPDVTHAAREVVAQLRTRLRDTIEEYEAAESQTNEPELWVGTATHPERVTYNLDDLSSELIVQIVKEIIQRNGSINRFKLVRLVSRRFGREYLIRVRRFVNRYIYPASGRGELRIQDDFIIA